MKKLLFILVSIWTTSLFAGGIEFTASVDKNLVTIGERFTLTYELNTSGSGFVAPDLSENFRVLSGPNQSRSMSMMNGKVSSTLSYSFVLEPINIGEFTIGQAEIKADGKKVKSKSLKIKVVKVSKEAENQKNKEADDLKKQLSKNLYLKLELSKRKAYVGEQILATYKLYNRANLSGISGEKMPEFVGFYTQDIEINETNQRKREVVNGVIFDVYTLKKTILFPQKTGNLELQPLIIDASVSVKSKKPVNTWFGPQYKYRNEKVKIQSQKTKIKVIPLPNNKPESFQGAVGTFKLTAEMDKNAVKSNEALNLKIKIKGTGNINLSEIQTPEFPTDFEVYDPKINTNTNKKNGILSGNKTWEYLVIPRHSGDFELDPILFSYFDPSSKKYITLKSDPFKIHVDKSEDEEELVTYKGGKSQKKIEQVGSDIRYIKISTPQFVEPGTRFYRSFWFYFLILLPLTILIVVYYFLKKYADMTSDTVGMKKRKANRTASKHLNEAAKLMEANDTNAFYDAISKALFGYISDKVNIPKSDQSKDFISKKLADLGVSKAVIDLFTQTLDTCEMARFSPNAEGSVQSIFNDASNVITQLEGELK